MTKRRPLLAAAFALTVLGGGIAASSVAQAQHSPTGTIPRTSTTEKPTPNTLQSVCNNGDSGVAGGKCTTYSTVQTRTKNAALPSQTAMPTPTVIALPTNTATKPTSPRTKNGTIATTTAVPKPVTSPAPMRTTTTLLRVKNAAPKGPKTTPATTCGGYCPSTGK